MHPRHLLLRKLYTARSGIFALCGLLLDLWLQHFMIVKSCSIGCVHILEYDEVIISAEGQVKDSF